jgi:hypothetical protein
MLRRHAIMTTIAALAALGTTAFDAVASGAAPRGRRRSSGQAAPRVYRSYSVSPESAAIPESVPGADAARVVGPQPAPAPAQARAARPSRSKPSYMRADSKANGRFGQ